MADCASAMLAWTAFYIYRKFYIEPDKFGYQPDLEFNTSFYIGLVLVPAFWLSLYGMAGTYRYPYYKSRLKELAQTLWQTIVGVICLFFLLLLDDEIANYKSYYRLIAGLFLLHLICTFSLRFLLTATTVKRIHRREIGFNTLLIGGNQIALELHDELEAQKNSSGFRLLGFIHVEQAEEYPVSSVLPHLGNMDRIREIIGVLKIEEVIIAIESHEHEHLRTILTRLEMENVNIKVIPDIYDILSGQVKMTSIFGAPLVEITHELLPAWQQHLKRIMDIAFSALVLVLFSPLYLLLIVLVKMSSKGPAFYSHERIGIYGRPFKIYKFRSMYTDAEKKGPQLAKENDPRVTPLGRFMRKTRLDEIPQFYNVLKGDMSLVGPRPERQYFIDQIAEVAPHYLHLQRVRPGITSWGQVKFGYAENVSEMVQRLKYDILYIENMSILVDLKIMIYTVLIMIQGRGK